MRWIRRVLVFVIGTVIAHYIWPISEKLGEAATTEWVNHQIAERYGIASPSQQKVVDFAVSWAVPAFAAILAYMIFRGGAWWGRRQAISAAVVSAPVSTPVATVQIADYSSARAKIILGTGHPFETVAPAGKNRNRTVRVKIENVTDAEISNGTVSILSLDPPQKEHTNFFLKGDITIGPRRHIFIDVANYSEGTSRAPPGPWIRLLIPIPAGYLFIGLPGNLPVRPHTFQLNFSSLEGRTLDEVFCRLFVDSNHVLHLENLGDSSAVTPAAPKMPITEFIQLAGQRDWRVSGEHNLEAADLMDGLRQAGSEGIIRFWGRLNRQGNRFQIENEISVPVPPEHWYDFEFDWTSVLSAKDNVETSTYNLHKPDTRYQGGYVDIYLDRTAATAWLGAGASAFKGRRRLPADRRT